MKLKFVFPALFVAILIAAFITTQPAHSQTAPRRIEVTAKRFDFTPAEITACAWMLTPSPTMASAATTAVG